MIVVRDVFHAKYGKGSELVRMLKEASMEATALKFDRVLTDASGPFFTIVTERTVESLAAWEKERDMLFSEPKFGEWFEKMMPLVDSGSREFFNIE
jgi:hypothetical protein